MYIYNIIPTLPKLCFKTALFFQFTQHLQNRSQNRSQNLNGIITMPTCKYSMKYLR